MHRIPGRVMRMDPEQKKMYRELQKTLRKIQIVLYELDPTLVDSQHRWRRIGRQFGQGVIKGLGGAVGLQFWALLSWRYLLRWQRTISLSLEIL